MLRGREFGDALAEGAVADLVVVLEKGDEGGGRQMRRALAAGRALVARMLALVGEALGERTRQPLDRCIGEVLIVAVGLTA